ncbi:sensor histidine kinase [Streptomyces sp. S3(2020)]|uniref:sensor histidine kinase n=1 Tax=Streptomyces sp. S3(2020) TaxID=2732044 RepID=UPI001489584A|nr:histidine kinase [Streptomyces sp. S3(2020)]NNN33872.1 sensor histidine kinase [Streptomyces sp. S3(2020)]
MTDNRRTRPLPVDAAVSTALFVCAFPGSVVTLPGHDLQVPWWPGILLAGGGCLALLWHRGRPRTTVAVALACAAVSSALGYLLTVLLLGPLMVALYSLAVRTDRRTANTAACAAIAVLVITSLLAGPTDEPLVLKLLGPTAWLLLPTSLGTVARLRTAYLDAVRARAEDAERTREEEARRRVAEERVRIARDLHDVVAHHLVLANLQAGALARHLPARPEEAGRLALDLGGTTAAAMRELRATVGLLRHAPDEGNPPVGLARLPDLAASFRHAGLTVDVVTEGEPRQLPAGADLTAYRIVQEALTNVTKHADTGSAEVRLTYSPGLLGIAVTNGGSVPATAAPGGYGLVGMRERALSVGGRVRAGRRAQGGFEVVAELPVGPVENPLA